MKVLFERNWFAPSDTENEGKLNQSSGQRFKKGLRDVPDTLKRFLPKGAKIVEDAAEVPVVEVVQKIETLRDFDDVRAASDAAIETIEKAQEHRAQLELDVVVKRGPGRPRKEVQVQA